MELPNLIPKRLTKVWDIWDLRVFLLLSLFFQTCLVLFSSLRKRKARNRVTALVWSSYLLADWVAIFALGLISNGIGKLSDSDPYADLLAFWAPFLLLHLGGPDTITAFALEDNELWLRHLLGLLTQLFAAVYVFLRSLPTRYLWVPTILMFFAGTVKYAERTRALYLASLDRFRDSMVTDPDPGPNYAKLMEELSSKEEAQLPTSIEMIKEPDQEFKDYHDRKLEEGASSKDLTGINVVKPAYEFFVTFKGLIVDLIFSFHDRNKSQQFFLQRSPEDAFRVMEIELNFMYDVLYTKVAVVHNRSWIVLRFICFCSIVASFFLFLFHTKKGLNKNDIIITYILLIGAMILDFIALLMLIFSDWTIALFIDSNKSIIRAIHKVIPVFKRSRWSGKISQYNLIKSCLEEHRNWVSKIAGFFGLESYLDEYHYKSRKKVTPELRKFIFDNLTEKTRNANKDPEIIKAIYSARGDWALRRSNCSSSLDWSVEVEYDESLLLWHIATEILFQIRDEREPGNENIKKSQIFCKIISDYMSYLLVMQPTMMASVAGIGQIRFRDTCAEAKMFFNRGESSPDGPDQKNACTNLHSVNTKVKPADVKGDRSKSVLFDACILAKKLEKLKEEKWKIMSEVWVELLSYAASHCRANAHAQQLSKGGELLTFVWLLMAHLGIGEQFRIERGHARAKLIVGK